MRNIVVHDYGSIDIKIVWKTAREDVPALLDFANTALKIPKERESVIAKLNQAKEKVKQQDTPKDIKTKNINNEIE